MPTFDVVSVTDMQEVDNAVNSAVREISNRYDFRGSKSTITREDKEVTILADDDMKLKAMQDSLKTHFTKRQLDAKALDFGKPEAASGAMVRQKIKVKQGIEQEIAKKIVKHIKDSKMKVQASIRGEELRIQGAKRDDLQTAIALIKAMDVDCPLQFVNFRD